MAKPPIKIHGQAIEMPTPSERAGKVTLRDRRHQGINLATDVLDLIDTSRRVGWLIEHIKWLDGILDEQEAWLNNPENREHEKYHARREYWGKTLADYRRSRGERTAADSRVMTLVSRIAKTVRDAEAQVIEDVTEFYGPLDRKSLADLASHAQGEFHKTTTDIINERLDAEWAGSYHAQRRETEAA